MNLLEVTVSMLLMAAGASVSVAAWTSSTSQIQFAKDMEAAGFCANNAAEVLMANGKVQTGQSALEENLENDGSCKIQIIDESFGKETWAHVLVTSGRATVSLWLKTGLS